MESESGLNVLNYCHSDDNILVSLGVLGHPFGRVPTPKPFDSNLKEAEVILSDPASPIGKDLIAGKYTEVRCAQLQCRLCHTPNT